MFALHKHSNKLELVILSWITAFWNQPVAYPVVNHTVVKVDFWIVICLCIDYTDVNIRQKCNDLYIVLNCIT